MKVPSDVHWKDAAGVLCGFAGPCLTGAPNWIPGLRSAVVDCIDCRTIAALVQECEDETERSETLARERARYAARK